MLQLTNHHIHTFHTAMLSLREAKARRDREGPLTAELKAVVEAEPTSVDGVRWCEV